VKIKYARDYTESDDEAFLETTDASQYEIVRDAYRQMPTLEFETLLPTSVLANARAAYDALRYGVMRKHVTVEPMGKEFLSLRVYDTLIIEATTGTVDADYESVDADREWLGIWKAQVLAVNPDLDGVRNEIEIVLIEEIVGIGPDVYVLASEGNFITAEAGVNRFIRSEA